MTKKSKPASLTSSLLARKGEAEPSSPPYTLPELDRPKPGQPAADATQGDSTADQQAADATDGAPGESEAGRVYEGAEDAAAPVPGFQTSNGQDHTHDYSAGGLNQLPLTESAKAEPPAGETPEAQGIETPEATVAASAQVIGHEDPAASAAATEASADAAPQDAKREAARDARLLRFVYITAALTGVVAILLYAGGWFLDSGAPKEAETTSSSTVAATSGETSSATESSAPPASTGETPAAGAPELSASETKTPGSGDSGPPSGSDSASSMPAIPPAPPVAPDFTESGSKPPSTAVTTGGKPKTPSSPAPEKPDTPAQTATDTAAKEPESASAAASGTETPSAPKTETSAVASAPSVPSIDKPAAKETPSEPAAASTGAIAEPKAPPASKAPAETASVPTIAPPPPVVPVPAPPPTIKSPPPVASVTDSKPPAKPAAKPAKKVPNLRVLAPALVRPEPPEKAGAAKAPPPKGKAAKEAERTAALTPPAPKAGSTGRYMVQLSSVSSPDRARKEWARLQKVYPDLFGDRELVLEQRVIANRGKFFRVQTGRYETLKEARAVCATLKAKNQGCLPLKR